MTNGTTMINKKLTLGVVAGASLAALVFVMMRPNSPVLDAGHEAPVQRVLVKQTTTTPKVMVAEPGAAIGEVSTPRSHDQMVAAQSLQGTEIDGAISANPDGTLILNQDIRDFFDYFLSAADELGPEAAIAEIQRYIDSYLPQPASSEAQALLQNYLRYKAYEQKMQRQPVVGLNTDSDALVLLRDSFDVMKQKRLELFSEAQNTALFGLEETYQEHTLSTLELFADESLSDEDRQAQLANLESALPPSLQASRAEDASHRQQQDELRSLNNSAIDNAAYHQRLTDSGVSDEKADELLAYRQRQNQFEQTYQQYRSSIDRLDRTAEDFDVQLAQVQNQYFLTPEDRTQARLRDLSVE